MNTAIIRVTTDLQPGIVDIELPVADVLEFVRLSADLERQMLARLTSKKEN